MSEVRFDYDFTGPWCGVCSSDERHTRSILISDCKLCRAHCCEKCYVRYISSLCYGFTPPSSNFPLELCHLIADYTVGTWGYSERRGELTPRKYSVMQGCKTCKPLPGILASLYQPKKDLSRLSPEKRRREIKMRKRRRLNRTYTK